MKPLKYKFKNNHFSIIFVITIISICYALYAQYIELVEPCPLCIAQRILIILISALSFIGIFFNRTKKIAIPLQLLIISISLFTIKVASRHLWLMSLPLDKQPQSCGMPLIVKFQRTSLPDFIEFILKGSAECGAVSWKVFGMSAPYSVIALSLIIIVLTLIALYRIIKN